MRARAGARVGVGVRVEVRVRDRVRVRGCAKFTMKGTRNCMSVAWCSG